MKFQSLSWHLEKNHFVVFGKTLGGDFVHFFLRGYTLPILVGLDNLDPEQQLAVRFELSTRFNVRQITNIIGKDFQNSLKFPNDDVTSPPHHEKQQFLKIDLTSLNDYYRVRTFLNIGPLNQKYYRVSRDSQVLITQLYLYNSDIQPITKFFMHHPTFLPCGWYNIVAGASGQTISVKQLEPLPDCTDQCPLRVCSFDFETHGTNPSKDAIFQIGITWYTCYATDPSIKRILLNWGPCDVIDEPPTIVKVVENEQALLQVFFNELGNEPFDFLTGYNIFGFDIKMLAGRLKLYPQIQTNKIHRIAHVASNRAIFKEKKSGNAEGNLQFYYMDIIGCTLLDLYPMMKKYDNRLKKYSLNAVSNKYLGEQKIDLSYKEMKTLVEKGQAADYHRIGVYCIQDTKLPIMLLQTLDLLLFQINLCNVSHFPLNLAFIYGEQQKIYAHIYTVATQKGFVFFTDFHHRENTEAVSFQGATVLPPQAGLYENQVACLDFKSLYPTLMISNNLCPTTYLSVRNDAGEDVEMMKGKNDLILQTETDGGKHHFIKATVHKGVIPFILDRLLNEREQLKKQMKALDAPHAQENKEAYNKLNSKQLATKVCANSIYGIFGATGPLRCIPLSQTTTALGREMIRQTVDYCHDEKTTQKYGQLKVVYGDSVTKNTLLTLKINNKVQVMTFEELWLEVAKQRQRVLDTFLSPYTMNVSPATSNNDKEVFHTDDLQIFTWSDQAWTKVNCVIRHHHRVQKLYRITTRRGIVEVTGDHSLLKRNEHGEMVCVSPKDLNIGDTLVHKQFENYQ